jgi:hypothetical protein
MAFADLATSLGGVGPGTYVFGQLVLNEETGGVNMIEPTTEVEFVGEEQNLKPLSNVREHAVREGNIVTITPSEEMKKETDEVIIERDDSDGNNATELILEQVLQSPLLHTLLFFEEGIEEVRYVSGVAERLLRHVRIGYEIDDTVVFNGETYRIRTA